MGTFDEDHNYIPDPFEHVSFDDEVWKDRQGRIHLWHEMDDAYLKRVYNILDKQGWCKPVLLLVEMRIRNIFIKKGKE